MAPPVRSVLFGSELPARQRYSSLVLAVGLFGITFAAYALDIFAVAGGVVFVPGHAALVGVVGAVWVGSQQRGLVIAWVVAYAALLGYSADHYLFGLSGRSFFDRVTAFLGLDGLVFLGIEALVLGTLGFLLGTCCRWGFAFVWEKSTHSEASE